MHLTPDERDRIDRCVADFEARTGAQVVAAVVDRSDHYPEIPWKAFALGTAVAAPMLLVLDQLRPNWQSAQHTLGLLVATLGAGALLALAALRVRALARLFLSAVRAEAEVQQHARELFLSHELFATAGRNGLLILVSRFERRVVLLPDAKLHARLAQTDLQRIVDKVTAMLAQGRVCDGLCRGIAEAAELLRAHGFTAIGGGPNELPDAIIEEDGDAAR